MRLLNVAAARCTVLDLHKCCLETGRVRDAHFHNHEKEKIMFVKFIVCRDYERIINDIIRLIMQKDENTFTSY